MYVSQVPAAASVATLNVGVRGRDARNPVTQEKANDPMPHYRIRQLDSRGRRAQLHDPGAWRLPGQLFPVGVAAAAALYQAGLAGAATPPCPALLFTPTKTLYETGHVPSFI